MLIHIPLFSSEEEPANMQLFLLFSALQSFYANENDAPLLVSTNHQDLYDKILEFRYNSNYPFTVEFISNKELKKLFKLPETITSSQRFINYFASKFYPVFAKLDKRILHVDYDVVFNNKIDFELYFESPITLVSSIKNHSAINTGVMAMQQSAFHIITKLVGNEKLHLTNEIAGEFINMINDETMFIDIQKKNLLWEVQLSNDKSRQLLAYELSVVEEWKTLPSILHFHWYKPLNCRVTKSGPNYGAINIKKMGVSAEQIAERFNNEFYLSILLWYKHLLDAENYLPKSVQLEQIVNKDDLLFELYRTNLKEGIYTPPIQTGNRRRQMM